MDYRGKIGHFVAALSLILFLDAPAVANAAESPPSAPPQAIPVKGPAEAESFEGPTNGVTQLPEVVVTATRTAEDTRNISQSITVVTRGNIARRQVETPNQMLSEEPGIWSVQAAAQGSPIIRGEIGNRVLYLWNGIPLNNGALFAGPNGYFNQIPIGSVGRMEVIRGPGSVQYGSDAIGGVINVLSKRVDAFPERFETGGEVYARYGSVNEEATETADFWMADTNWSAFGGFSIQNVGDYRGPGVGVLKNTGFDAIGGNLDLAYQPAANQTLRLSWIYNDRENVQ